MTTHTQALYAKLDENVAQLFAKHAEHLQCSKGCSDCCENGAGFVIRLAEWLEVKQALTMLSPPTLAKIEANLNKANNETCPLLIDAACSVYNTRPALCRAYGLILTTQGKTATCKLNYNNLATNETLDVLDLDPFYALLDEISAHLQTTGTQQPLKQSIKDWLLNPNS